MAYEPSGFIWRAKKMTDERFAGISDQDLWAEWLRRQKIRQLEVAKEYQREYKRKVRAGVKKGKRGMRLMQKYWKA